MVYKEKKFFRSLLEKSSCLRPLALKGKYLERFYELLECEYLEKNTPGYVNSKYERVNSSFLKLLIVSLGAILSILLWPFYSYKIKCKDGHLNKLVFVPFADYIVRYRDVFSITDHPISVVYPPIFHYSKILRHIKHFNEIKKPIKLGCFNILDVVRAFLVTLSQLKPLTRIERDINCHFNLSGNKIFVVYFQFLLYSLYFKRLLENNNDAARTWFFDYDLDTKYLAFNQILHLMRPKDKTVHMHHGVFHEANMTYSNTVADFAFCCSNREKKIIDGGNNAYGSNVLVQGCPLQSLHVQGKGAKIKYKLLILLVSIDNEEICNLQLYLLKFFDYMKEDVILRYRPASRHIDEKVFSKCTFGYNVSNGTTLEEDVKSANCVISFSEDSVFSCFRDNIKLILFVSEREYNIYKAINGKSYNMMVCSTKHCDEKLLHSFVDSEEHCDYIHDNMVIENFGVFTLPAYRKQFENNLKNIENASC